jgi:SAM-dependent methyltransferase
MRDRPPSETAGRVSPRLYPPRTHRCYYVLNATRRALSEMARIYCPDHPRGTLLDYGCGDKPYQPLFAPFVDTHIGADVADADVALTATGRVSLPDAAASVVLSTQVLEHVPDPSAYVAECARLLTERGLLFLSTHGIWRYHPAPGDYWRWTRDGLGRLLSAHFALLEIRGLVGLAAAGMQLTQDGLIEWIPRRFHRLAIPAFQVLISLLDRTARPSDRLDDASVFVAVAEKK